MRQLWKHGDHGGTEKRPWGRARDLPTFESAPCTFSYSLFSCPLRSSALFAVIIFRRPMVIDARASIFGLLPGAGIVPPGVMQFPKRSSFTAEVAEERRGRNRAMRETCGHNSLLGGLVVRICSGILLVTICLLLSRPCAAAWETNGDWQVAGEDCLSVRRSDNALAWNPAMTPRVVVGLRRHQDPQDPCCARRLSQAGLRRRRAETTARREPALPWWQTFADRSGNHFCAPNPARSSPASGFLAATRLFHCGSRTSATR